MAYRLGVSITPYDREELAATHSVVRESDIARARTQSLGLPPPALPDEIHILEADARIRCVHGRAMTPTEWHVWSNYLSNKSSCRRPEDFGGAVGSFIDAVPRQVADHIALVFEACVFDRLEIWHNHTTLYVFGRIWHGIAYHLWEVAAFTRWESESLKTYEDAKSMYLRNLEWDARVLRDENWWWRWIGSALIPLLIGAAGGILTWYKEGLLTAALGVTFVGLVVSFACTAMRWRDVKTRRKEVSDKLPVAKDLDSDLKLSAELSLVEQLRRDWRLVLGIPRRVGAFLEGWRQAG